VTDGDSRLPAHIEVSALLRRTQATGGFATVIRKGHRDAGTLLVVLTHNGTGTRACERMPQVDGSRRWEVSRRQDPANPAEFDDYLSRRARQDDDLWIVELDSVNGEQLIGLNAYQA
jgi:hypothetical protein